MYNNGLTSINFEGKRVSIRTVCDEFRFNIETNPVHLKKNLQIIVY